MSNNESLLSKTKEIKKLAFEMVLKASTGHLGGSFSCAEILVALYYGKIMRFDPKNPEWKDRDRFILSKGHANNTYYAILSDLGYYEKSELDNYCQYQSFLGNHCDKTVPGVEMITGSLGHGLGIACGISLGAKLSGENFRTFVVIGDGESQEGSIWEAAMFAAQHKLDNLVVFLDRNRLGSEDFTENTSGLNPLEKKWEAFGWRVKSIDGHSFPEIFAALSDLNSKDLSSPLMIIANTIKGHGISFLENTPKAHHTVPRGEEIEIARGELS
jgi:transketolase